MPNFRVIAEVDDLSVARVLVTALKAHGFSPQEGSDGLPGMPGISGIRGTFAVRVPDGEADDAKLLADDLILEMKR